MSDAPTTAHAIEQVHALVPAVLGDGWRKDHGEAARDRVWALAAAAGHLLRLGTALEACGEDGAGALRASAPAWLALRRNANWLPSASAIGARMVELAHRAQGLALTPEEPSAVPSLADRGDPIAAAERLVVLDEADELVSVAAALRQVRGEEVRELWGAGLRIGRHLRQGVRRATWGRIERVAARECDARALFADPFGQPLWVSLLEPDRRAALLEAGAAPVASTERLAAHTPEPGPRSHAPGEVGILLYSERSGAGRAYLIRVTAGASNLWGADHRWSDRAWSAVRMGFLAATRAWPLGVPPAPLEGHRVEIDAPVYVDGDSLGLPIALAFYSLWSGRGLPYGTCATGVITPNGGIKAVVEATLGHKVAAWVDQFSHVDGPALIPDQPGAPDGTIRCASLSIALAACALEPPQQPPIGADVSTRAAQLWHAMQAVDRQDLSTIAPIPGGSPWALLGDLVYRLARSLDGEDHLEVDLGIARTKAALAWLHAGEVDRVEEILDELPSAGLPPAVALVRETVALAGCIDRPDPEVGQPHDEALATLIEDPTTLPIDRHKALGTRGRWRLHRHDPEALAFLEQAVAVAPAIERARSRTYLSQALRVTGRPHEALREVGLAKEDLDDVRKRSLTYAASTEMYLLYEEARVRLALGEASLARELIERALRSAPSGVWPRAGFLRVAAVAARRDGDEARASALVGELEDLVADAPPAYDWLLRPILAEARGESVDPPVVY